MGARDMLAATAVESPPIEDDLGGVAAVTEEAVGNGVGLANLASCKAWRDFSILDITAL